MANLKRVLVYLTTTVIIFFVNSVFNEVYGVEKFNPESSQGLRSKAWIDPAPIPVDPTDPRDPRPPLPLPYPEPPIPSPIPISPNVHELIDIIKGLKIEIQSLRHKIVELEARLNEKSSHKNKNIEPCNAYLQQLETAIIKLAKSDKTTDILSKNIDRIFLSKLFQSGLLESIPPYHNQIKGSLETNLSCQK
ncbi:MAG: hypothetical protein VX619_04575 [bacterium]|nr:hypothetical protein [bacterium]